MTGEYDLRNPNDLAVVKAEIYRDEWSSFARGEPIDNSTLKTGALEVIDTAARHGLRVRKSDLTFVNPKTGEPASVGFVLDCVWPGPLDYQPINPALVWDEDSLTLAEINELTRMEID